MGKNEANLLFHLQVKETNILSHWGTTYHQNQNKNIFVKYLFNKIAKNDKQIKKPVVMLDDIKILNRLFMI